LGDSFEKFKSEPEQESQSISCPVIDGLHLTSLTEYCCDRKSRAACAQSFALWQQAATEFTCHGHSIIACSCHIYEWCCSSRTSRWWWITQSTQHHRRGCSKAIEKHDKCTRTDSAVGTSMVVKCFLLAYQSSIPVLTAWLESSVCPKRCHLVVHTRKHCQESPVPTRRPVRFQNLEPGYSSIPRTTQSQPATPALLAVQRHNQEIHALL